jgi:hypothetical protein
MPEALRGCAGRVHATVDDTKPYPLLRVGVLLTLVLAGLGCGALLFATSASAQAPKPAATAKPAAGAQSFNMAAIVALIRNSLIALDHGNKTNNYTVLRDLAAPAFQINTAARLSDIFAGLRRDGLDMSGVVVVDPTLTLGPKIEKNGLLHVSGAFPYGPQILNFDLTYAPVENQWRLFGISVALKPAPAPTPTAATAGAPR